METTSQFSVTTDTGFQEVATYIGNNVVLYFWIIFLIQGIKRNILSLITSKLEEQKEAPYPGWTDSNSASCHSLMLEIDNVFNP